MKPIAIWLLAITLLFTANALAQPEMPKVQVETTKGIIVIELNPQAAPKTVENFLAYAKAGFYDGTIFHRVIKGFMIQGGGMTPDMQSKPTRPPVANEADNGLKNVKGTIAMARTNDPHSATSQFFINTVNNASLDYKSKSQFGWGYCVFGKVVQGMEVVQAIEGVNTTVRGRHSDVPAEPVVITKLTVAGSAEPAKPETQVKK
jgi:peptidyl-prolyl cis-trans isomerase B (cyclophilin B)